MIDQLLAPLYRFSPAFHTCEAIKKLATPMNKNNVIWPKFKSPRNACNGIVVATAIGMMNVTMTLNQMG